jgi:hypothetical protein
MFQITKEELKTIMVLQNVISRRGGNRKFPYVFTEQAIYLDYSLKGDLANVVKIIAGHL